MSSTAALHHALVSVGLFDRIKVATLKVFNESKLEYLHIVGLYHTDRHFFHLGKLARLPPTLASNDFVIILDLTYNNWLKKTVFLDGGGEFLELILIEMHAGLIRIGLNALYIDFNSNIVALQCVSSELLLCSVSLNCIGGTHGSSGRHSGGILRDAPMGRNALLCRRLGNALNDAHDSHAIVIFDKFLLCNHILDCNSRFNRFRRGLNRRGLLFLSVENSTLLLRKILLPDDFPLGGSCGSYPAFNRINCRSGSRGSLLTLHLRRRRCRTSGLHSCLIPSQERIKAASKAAFGVFSHEKSLPSQVHGKPLRLFRSDRTA